MQMELREFISTLEKYGYLRKISHPVNWKYEIGEIVRQNHTQPLLFENIADYPGCRLFTEDFPESIIWDQSGVKDACKQKVVIGPFKEGFRKPIESVYVQCCPDCLYKAADDQFT